MPLRFIHAADLHLDSPLAGLTRPGDDEEAAADAALVRSASRRALEALVDRAVAEKVAFVVLSGDLWDGSCVDVSTGLFFQKEMRRLRAAGIAVFAILGNHDAESTITRTPALLADVHLFPPDRATTVTPEGMEVAVHGRSFPEPAFTDNMALAYPDPVAGIANVALLHTGLDGRPGHDRYAPCTVADLEGKGYDYWALGHIHAREVVAAPQAAGEGATIAYSGVLQGRHIRETGPKGAFLVTLGDGPPRLTEVDLDIVRWARLEADLSGAETLEEADTMVRAQLRNQAAALARGADERLVAARVMAAGETALHGALGLSRAWIRERALMAAGEAGLHRLFLEKVAVGTRPPAAPAPGPAGEIADLLGALLDGARDDDALVAELLAHMRTVLVSLPGEARSRGEPGGILEIVRDLEPDLVAAVETGDLRPVLSAAAARVRAGLSGPA